MTRRMVWAGGVVCVLWLGKTLPSTNPQRSPAAILLYVVLLTVTIAVVARRFDPMDSDAWTWSSSGFWLGASAGVGLFLVAGIGYAVSGSLLGLTPPPEANLAASHTGADLVSLLGLVSCAAILEEWVFRDVLLDGFHSQPGWAAVVASAMLFAVYHLSLFQLLPTFLLGVGLCVLVLVTGSVWPAVVAHVVFNTVGITLSAFSR